MRSLIVAAMGVVALISPAAAQMSGPSAIVEEVNGDVQGVEAMDYVMPGKVIKLGAKVSAAKVAGKVLSPED